MLEIFKDGLWYYTRNESIVSCSCFPLDVKLNEWYFKFEFVKGDKGCKNTHVYGTKLAGLSNDCIRV